MESAAKILVIDDELGIRDMLSFELGSQGYSVSTAADGEEGIVKTRGESFDLVILDMKMPGMGGLEALERIKKINPDIEVIVATGFGTVETAVESMKKGSYDYISKPFNIDELNALIQKALEKKELKLAVTLYKACRTLFSSLDLNELLKIVVELMVKAVNADDTSIMLFDSDQRLHIMASYRLDEEIKTKTRLEIGERVAGRIAQKREPVLLNDGLSNYPEFAGVEAFKEIRSSIVCPLLTQKKVWGVINLNRIAIPDNFTDSDLRNITVFATQIAQAIENANLYKGLETKIEELKKAYHDLNGAKALLEESNKFIESVISSMTDAFIVIDGKGKIIKSNSAAAALVSLNNRGPGIAGRNILDLLTLTDSAGEPVPKLFQIRQSIANLEVVYRQGDGRDLSLSLSASPLFDLSDRITGTVVTLRDISAQKENEKNLIYLATHDALTNLPNRVLLKDRVNQAISQAPRLGRFVSILMLDMDRFKEVNDTLGHDAGDSLLKEAAVRIRGCLREYDSLARMGGDEFVVVLVDLKSQEDAAVIADRILAVFERPIRIGGSDIQFAASIGISNYPENGGTLEALLKSADMAMYSAKQLGGSRYYFFTQSIGKAAEERMTLKDELRKALDKGEFTLHYQPLIDTDTGRIVSAEALIRWRHPDRGVVEPRNFITVAESTGLILPIGEWVLRAACGQCADWRKAGFEDVQVAVNLSARQLYDAGLVKKTAGALEECGLPPGSLVAEITESAAMQNMEVAVQALKELNRLGVGVCIDDFGSGYSSLNWLKSMPVSALKIDRFFVQNIAEDPSDAAIVRAVIAMAHSLGLKVIAEGVETPQQLEILKTAKWPYEEILKCDQMQGFLFSKPLPPEEFQALLRERKNMPA